MPERSDDQPSDSLYIMSLSIHGLVRGTNIELGRDVDTGGQVAYTVDQARALCALDDVERMDLVTRLVEDRRIDEWYAAPSERLQPGAQIVRIPFGPRRYLRKERLWPYLDSMRDQLIRHIRSVRRAPDLIHGHYADAGYVGAQLAKVLGVPFVFTGHSLGRVKLATLLADGGDRDTLEQRYRFTQRIEAEELSLETAALVITSTNQEVEEQYQLYDHYEPDRMAVIPPGVDLSRFTPAPVGEFEPRVTGELRRFLRSPDKPIILAIARPDERKNFPALLRAYGETPHLQELANLVLVAGTRDDLAEMPVGQRRVLNQILYLIDRYDLYGRVAYPKSTESQDVVDLYRLAARSRGVFVNPALTEPFGLTLIEAAACGLPVVSTDDGGPKDIIAKARNGLLVDPTDTAAIAHALVRALSSDEWDSWARNGIEVAKSTFSWQGHAEQYLHHVRTTVTSLSRVGYDVAVKRSRLPQVDRWLVSDIDNTLTGDDAALRALIGQLGETRDEIGFAIATGRTLERAMEVIELLELPSPDILITASGTELFYGHDQLTRDRSWERQIDYRWFPDKIYDAMQRLEGFDPQEPVNQGRYRLSYDVDPDRAPSITDVRRHLRKAGLQVSAILDHGLYLDIIPIRAGPGHAIRFLCFKWDIPPDHLLVAGDSGNDADMLSGDTLGVVVANYSPELEYLKDRPRVYFARQPNAWGILEGIDHYDFFGAITVPEEAVT
jgi:sucrose-phosphate synthase